MTDAFTEPKATLTVRVIRAADGSVEEFTVPAEVTYPTEPDSEEQ